MKTLILILLLFPLAIADNPVSGDCKCNNIPLFGKVEIKNAHADFKIKVVAIDEDIRVDSTRPLPDKCGQWTIVKALGDFSVQFVDIGEDFTVRFVTIDEGID